MIVDSPGVGESEVMDEFVVNYMSNAFCFMYVINTHNAGGVQKDRVRIIVYVSIVLKLAKPNGNACYTGYTETANPSLENISTDITLLALLSSCR